MKKESLEEIVKVFGHSKINNEAIVFIPKHGSLYDVIKVDADKIKAFLISTK